MQEDISDLGDFLRPDIGPRIILLGSWLPDENILDKLSSSGIRYIRGASVDDVRIIIRQLADHSRVIITAVSTDDQVEQLLQSIDRNESLVYILLFSDRTENAITLADLIRPKEQG